VGSASTFVRQPYWLIWCPTDLRTRIEESIPFLPLDESAMKAGNRDSRHVTAILEHVSYLGLSASAPLVSPS
jgi:hypothetical protein